MEGYGVSESASASAANRFNNWLWRHKLIAALGLCLLAAWANYEVMKLADNPAPTKKRIVHGEFPYDRGLELRIEASYYSKNPTCQLTAFVFLIVPQATVSREGWRTILLVRDGGNRFRFEFFEDAVLPGFCEWDLKFVYYRIFKDGKRVQGEAILGFPGPFNVFRYRCENFSMPWTRADGTRVDEKRVVCNPGDSRRYEPKNTDHQIDFIWEQKQS